MNTYRWTCLACKSPNVLVHDESKEGHIALNCKQCGEPGVFEPEGKTVLMQGYPGYASTEMSAVVDSAVSIDYMAPQRIAKLPWTEEETETLRVLRKEKKTVEVPSPHWKV